MDERAQETGPCSEEMPILFCPPGCILVLTSPQTLRVSVVVPSLAIQALRRLRPWPRRVSAFLDLSLSLLEPFRESFQGQAIFLHQSPLSNEAELARNRG